MQKKLALPEAMRAAVLRRSAQALIVNANKKFTKTLQINQIKALVF